jgi:hypothetical protein
MVAGATMIGTVTTVLGLLVLWRLQAEGIWVALFLVPILLLATGPALSRQAAREGDRTLFWLLLAALTLKLLGSLVRYYIAYTVYEGLIDAQGYHETAAMIAERFRAGNFDTGLESLTGTAFVPFFTGLLYTLIGPSIYAGFLLFSWLGFWGLFYLYRAFTIAMPEGNRRSYAHLLFFLPSILYWPSAIGKDAWMLFTLGVAAYGMARALTGRLWRGLAVASLGLYGPRWSGPTSPAWPASPSPSPTSWAARPAGRGGARPRSSSSPRSSWWSCRCSYSARRPSSSRTAARSEDGVGSVLAETSRRTNEGGSSFATSSSITPLSLPVGVRDHPVPPVPVRGAQHPGGRDGAGEHDAAVADRPPAPRRLGGAATSAPAAVCGLRDGVHGHVRRGLLQLGNFGILARERVQLLPFFLVLLAVPPARESPAGPARPATTLGGSMPTGSSLARKGDQGGRPAQRSHDPAAAGRCRDPALPPGPWARGRDRHAAGAVRAPAGAVGRP